MDDRPSPRTDAPIRIAVAQPLVRLTSTDERGHTKMTDAVRRMASAVLRVKDVPLFGRLRQRRAEPHSRPLAIWISTSLRTQGGVATSVMNMLGGPLRENWQLVHIASHTDGSAVQKLARFVLAVLQFLEINGRRYVTLVHIHTASFGSFARKSCFAWLAKRLLGIPTIMHVHGAEFDLFYDNLSPMSRAWVARTLSRVDAVIALSDRWRETLLNRVPEANVHVIPNAVPVPTATRRPSPGRPPVALFVGRIGHRKGTFGLIRAWARATRPHGSRLVIVGDGSVREAQQLVEAIGVSDSVDVLGWQPRTRISDLMTASDVFVLPSLAEGQPMAILEAMAHGMAVIATSVGAIEETLAGGAAGMIVPPDDVEALIEALSVVLGNEEVRSHLAVTARHRVIANYSIERVSSDIDKLYRRVLTAAEANR